MKLLDVQNFRRVFLRLKDWIPPCLRQAQRQRRAGKGHEEGTEVLKEKLEDYSDIEMRILPWLYRSHRNTKLVPRFQEHFFLSCRAAVEP